MSAYEQGFDLLKSNPDLTLVEVMWLGPKDIEALEFLEGYKAARRQPASTAPPWSCAWCAPT